MSDLSFRIKSSDGTGFYTVTASRSSGFVKISCDCPAGMFGTHCRHRFDLVSGETKYCINPNQNDLAELAAMLDLTPLRGVADEIVALGREADHIKRRLAALKKTAARIMATGE